MTKNRFVLSLLCASALFSSLGSSARAQLQLTGITAFSTDMNGNIITTAAFNTFGGDTVNNVYVINDPVAQTYLNSGDSGGASAPTGVNISLAPGGREFFASVDPAMTTQGTFYGLNLFFNGNNSTPRISAFTAIDTPTGVANAGMTLANTGGLTTVAGANSLIFSANGYLVTLSLFNYASTRVAGLPTDYPEDAVGPFSVGANNTPDNFLDFTLTVVPEPSTWLLLVLGAGMTFVALGRRRFAA